MAARTDLLDQLARGVVLVLPAAHIGIDHRGLAAEAVVDDVGERFGERPGTHRAGATPDPDQVAVGIVQVAGAVFVGIGRPDDFAERVFLFGLDLAGRVHAGGEQTLIADLGA
ncbi:MAG: hypothetical protein AB7I68_15125 [Porticoccaceae bacterium]